jgi:hypothetical protein
MKYSTKDIIALVMLGIGVWAVLTLAVIKFLQIIGKY